MMIWLLEHLAPDNTCLTLDALVDLSGNTYPVAAKALREAFAADAVVRSEKDCYQLTEKGHELVAQKKAGLPVLLQSNTLSKTMAYRDTRPQRIWNAMRALEKFGFTDVFEAAGRGEDKATFKTTYGRFMRALVAIKYLWILPRNGQKKHACHHYLLLKNTGPFAPMIIDSGRAVIDRNTGETFHV